MNSKTKIFHTRPDFDAVETPNATLFVPLVKKPPLFHGKASETNSHWVLVFGFYVTKPHGKLVNWFLHNTIIYWKKLSNRPQIDY